MSWQTVKFTYVYIIAGIDVHGFNTIVDQIFRAMDSNSCMANVDVHTEYSGGLGRIAFSIPIDLPLPSLS